MLHAAPAWCARTKKLPSAVIAGRAAMPRPAPLPVCTRPPLQFEAMELVRTDTTMCCGKSSAGHCGHNAVLATLHDRDARTGLGNMVWTDPRGAVLGR